MPSASRLPVKSRGYAAHMEPSSHDPTDRTTPDANPLVSDAPTAGDLVSDAIGEHDAEQMHPVTANLPPLATFNVLIAFDENSEARQNIETLERVGIEGSHISYLALEPSPPDGEATPPDEGMMNQEQRMSSDGQVARSVGKGAASGAATGAGVGALVGVGLTLIPGVGTLAGLGLLGVALGGAAAGGDLGLVWGGFRKLGVSAAWEKSFVDVGEGKTIVGVHTDDVQELRNAIAHLPADRLLFFDRDGHPVDGPDA